MIYSANKLFEDFSLFKSQLNNIEVDNEEAVETMRHELEGYMNEHALACREPLCYEEDWKKFCSSPAYETLSKPLSDLFTYLYMALKENSDIGVLRMMMEGIISKLEEMKETEADSSGKTGSTGVAGEYFVMAELTRRGYVASLTSKNTKAIDLLVSDKKGRNLASVQVKTSNNKKQQTWKMSNSAESIAEDNLYYVFVNMNGGEPPSYYVVPSKYVAYRVKEDYDNWFNTPTKKGEPKKPTTMRTFSFLDEEEKNQYKDAWYLLGV